MKPIPDLKSSESGSLQKSVTRSLLTEPDWSIRTSCRVGPDSRFSGLARFLSISRAATICRSPQLRVVLPSAPLAPYPAYNSLQRPALKLHAASVMDSDFEALLNRASGGDEQAAVEIWNAYYQRLVSYARRKLRGVPRRDADEEDVALSAMNSFFDGARDGRLAPKDADELWKLLATITVRKASAQLRKRHADKRGGGKVRGDSAFDAAQIARSESPPDTLDGLSPGSVWPARNCCPLSTTGHYVKSRCCVWPVTPTTRSPTNSVAASPPSNAESPKSASAGRGRRARRPICPRSALRIVTQTRRPGTGRPTTAIGRQR